LTVVFSERAMTPRYWHAKLGEVELKASYSCVVVVRAYFKNFFGLHKGQRSRGSGGRKSPRGVQGQSPGRGSGVLRPPEAEKLL